VAVGNLFFLSYNGRVTTAPEINKNTTNRPQAEQTERNREEEEAFLRAAQPVIPAVWHRRCLLFDSKFDSNILTTLP
jgi:hypothetical protein